MYKQNTGYKTYNYTERSFIDLSVIIVNYKSWDPLQQCLNSLQLKDYKKLNLEVIVVDNCSKDNRLEEFSKQNTGILFVENTGNNGFANGCNVGAKFSSGKQLLFLNPDTIANEEALFQMSTNLQNNPNHGIVSCKQITSEGKEERYIRLFPSFTRLFGITRAIDRKFSKRYKELKETTNSVVFPDWVTGAVVCISKEEFDSVVGWNEDYWMYYEDVDLCKKIVDKGLQIALLKEVSVVHDHGGASRINVTTSSLTKSEVLISRHIYINNHFTGLKKYVSQILLVTETVISKVFFGVLGIVFFFIPKLVVQRLLCKNMVLYYFQCLKRGSWLSKRSMNF